MAKTGRRPHQATQETKVQVQKMVSYGVPYEAIASIIGVSLPTLRKHYRHELDIGSAEANSKVAESLFNSATDPQKPNVIAQIFWLKSRAGWRDSDKKDGKKEDRAAAAEEAVKKEKYKPQSPPRLKVVKNG